MDKHSSADQTISLNPITIPSLINIAIKHGVNASTLLNEVGISADSVTDPKATLTLGQLDALYSACGVSMGNPAFGLHMGNMTRLDSLNLIGSLIGTSDTLNHAVDHYHRFRELLHPFMDMDISIDGKEATLIYSPTVANDITLQPCYSEMFLTSILKIFSELTRKPFRLNRVELSYADPGYSDIYTNSFDAPVYFNRSQSAMIFDASLLDQALPGRYPELNSGFETQAEKYLLELDRLNSVECQVVRYLQENMGVRPISMQDAARRLNVTTRTLQRRLKKENTSYVGIRESIRFKQAQLYLTETNINIDEIASRLGFSEPTNFYHAFKRWASMSPGEFRRTNKPALQEREALMA
ncbi:MAG: AraC family transcriptional regulator [Pseudomonadales bacterium]|nr:AraC family transcriptional regulator [Pseudomonadales bacterium]